MTVLSAPPARLAPPRRTIREAWRELAESRQILANMVRRDFAAQHKNSFFGMAWSLVNPLLLVGIFTFVFYFLGSAPIGGRRYPFALFFFGGVVLWNFFNTAVQTATGSIVGGAYLIKKVYFPREILPLSQVFAALITFGFEFLVLMVAAPFFGVYPYWSLLWVPLVVAETFLVAYAIGLLLSALTVTFRDIEHFIGVAMQVLFWMTPVIYDLSLISNKSPWVAKAMRAVPTVDLVLAFRTVTLDHKLPGIFGLSYALVFGGLLYLFAHRVFIRRESNFAELI